MAANEHKNLDGDNLHVSKGFTAADVNTLETKNGNSETEWDRRRNLPPCLDYVSGQSLPPTTNAGDVYLIDGTGTEYTINSIIWTTGTSVVVSLQGIPNLSAWAANDYLIIEGASNNVHNGVFEITNVNDSLDAITITNPLVTDGTNDVGATGTCYVTLAEWGGIKKYDHATAGASLFAFIAAETGDICYDATDGNYRFYNGTDWSGTFATSAGGAIGGTTTSPYVPRTTAANTLGDSPMQSDATNMSVGKSVAAADRLGVQMDNSSTYGIRVYEPSTIPASTLNGFYTIIDGNATATELNGGYFEVDNANGAAAGVRGVAQTASSWNIGVFGDTQGLLTMYSLAEHIGYSQIGVAGASIRVGVAGVAHSDEGDSTDKIGVFSLVDYDAGTATAVSNGYNFYSKGIQEVGSGSFVDTYGLYLGANSGTISGIEYGIRENVGPQSLNAFDGRMDLGSGGNDTDVKLNVYSDGVVTKGVFVSMGSTTPAGNIAGGFFENNSNNASNSGQNAGVLGYAKPNTVGSVNDLAMNAGVIGFWGGYVNVATHAGGYFQATQRNTETVIYGAVGEVKSGNQGVGVIGRLETTQGNTFSGAVKGVYGIVNSTNSGATMNGNLIGVDGYAGIEDGTLGGTQIVGGQFRAVNGKPNQTVDYVYGIHVLGADSTDGSGTPSIIDYAYGIYVDGNTATGTINNSYGIYLNAHAGAGLGNKYGVYQAGASDDNYFAGDVGIGTTTPTEKLEVHGNLRVEGQAYSKIQTTTYTPTGADSAAAFLIDWDLGNVAIVDLSSCSGLVPVGHSNMNSGGNYFIKIIQHPTTPVNLDWSTTVKFPGGTAPTISTGAGAVDVVALTRISSSEILANFSQDYQ